MIEGKEYTWTSPTLIDLMEFEAQVGPIMDQVVVNSVRGRAYLAFLCLREKHPEMTLREINALDVVAWMAIWQMIRQAIPLWGSEEGAEVPPAKLPGPAGQPASGEGAEEENLPDSSTSSPSPSSSSPAGSPAAPEESA
jgi:hypothetical protein